MPAVMSVSFKCCHATTMPLQPLYDIVTPRLGACILCADAGGCCYCCSVKRSAHARTDAQAVLEGHMQAPEKVTLITGKHMMQKCQQQCKLLD